MKKLISLCLTLCILITLSTSAFAEIWIDDNTISETSYTVDGDVGTAAVTSGDSLTVNGNFTGNADCVSVNADDGAEVYVLDDGTGTAGNVAALDILGCAVDARNSSTVTVEGNVSAIDSFLEVVSAHEGATVTVGGDVFCGKKGIVAVDEGTVVTVFGDVTAEPYRVGDGDPVCIDVEYDATVIIGGDVIYEYNRAVRTLGGGTVIIEGTVVGSIESEGDTYIGEHEGNIVNPENVRYLIASINGVDITGSVLDRGTVEGVSKTYLFTSSAKENDLEGERICVTSTDSGKELSLNGSLPEGISGGLQGDGSIALIFDASKFKGGLQNLDELICLNAFLKDYPAASGGEVYVVIVPQSSSEILSVTGNALPLAMNNGHSGVTLPAGAAGADIKVFFNGAELPADAFSIYTHSDGSVSVILSNTYLLTLDAGVYEFTVTVGSEVITFTVLVSK